MRSSRAFVVGCLEALGEDRSRVDVDAAALKVAKALPPFPVGRRKTRTR